MGAVYRQLGLAVSPDDCSLALRGLQTLGLRLAHLEAATLEVANWLVDHDAIAEVYHPALPSCPGHEIWQRDFTGSASVFSFLFKDNVSTEQATTFLDSLKIFRIGLSWGGVTSLAVIYPDLERPGKDFAGRLVRLNVGLEHPADLIEDLHQAFQAALSTKK